MEAKQFWLTPRANENHNYTKTAFPFPRHPISVITAHCLPVAQVYATGCDLVIMDQNFERVQIIPGVNYDQVQISCVDCSADCGKIAAAYSNRVCIFAPVPHRASPGGNGPTSVSRQQQGGGDRAGNVREG